MKSEKEYYHIAVQMLRAVLMTGDGSAVTHVLHQHVAPLPLPDGQFLVELQAVMDAYLTLLSHLDVFAAAKRPEFFGLRELMKRVVEKRLQDEKTT
jgi:hypothetical protein